MSNYIKASVKRPTGNPGKAIQPRDLLVIYDVDDIAYFPERDGAGVVITDDIVLNSGAYGIELYLTPGTVEITSPSDGDPDAEGFTPSIKFNHPGNKQEIREFKTNWLGRNAVIVVRYCTGESDLLGSPCNPMRLSVAYTGNSDGNTNELTFAQAMKGDDIAIYKGTLTLEEPVATVDAGADTVTYVSDGQYQLSDGSGAIKSIEGGSHGSIITLLGGNVTTTSSSSSTATETESGTDTLPTCVVASDTILLKDGATWTGTLGSTLTLRAFSKDSDGTLVWIEQSRYEV